MGDAMPMWAQRIRRERQARRWSYADAARELCEASGGKVSQAAAMRSWKRWEAGEVDEPDAFNKPLIAQIFNLATAVLFPRSPAETDRALVAVTGMDTVELVARLRASDVSASTLDALAITVDRLGREYSRVDTAQLYVEGTEWLGRLSSLLDRRLTLAQHREVLALAGRVALLVGCVEYDMGRAQPAESTRQAALSLGKESGDVDTVGWAHEMRAWYALTQGQYRAAVAATDTGLAAVGPAHSVAVQLLAHRAKAWARMGDRGQVDKALHRGREVLEGLPYPDNPDNHFVVDPSKWDFYTMDCYRHVGANDLAQMYAEEVLRGAVAPDGTDLRPMRAAEARVTLGVVAARQGDVDAAVAYGRAAIATGRRSLPSLLLHGRELAEELSQRYPDAPEAAAYVDELRAVRAAA